MDSGRELADDDAARGGAPGVVVSERSGSDKEDMGRAFFHTTSTTTLSYTRTDTSADPHTFRTNPRLAATVFA